MTTRALGPRRRRSAFTLIELLTVIAIIIILAALLFPMFAGATDKATGTRCLSQLRQWGAALNLYLNDTQGVMPGQGSPAGLADPKPNKDTVNAWFNVLPPYVGEQAISNLWVARQMPRPRDKSIFICPAAKPEPALPASDRRTFYSSYAQNLWIEAANRGRDQGSEKNVAAGLTRYPLLLRLSQVPDATRFPVLAEQGTGPGPDGSPGYLYAHTHAYYMGFPTTGNAFRHADHAGVMFADGHAVSYTKDQIWTNGMNKYWNYAGVIWNPDNPNTNGP